MFDGVTRGFVKPFFGLQDDADNEEEEEEEEAKKEKWNGEWEAGEERWGWKCFGKGEIRRGW